MNPVIEIIKSRGSVRKYLAKQVSAEDVKEIIETGIYSPTSKNKQPWYFTVIQNKEEIDFLNERTKEALRNGVIENQKYGEKVDYHVYHNAPTVVIVSYREDASDPKADISSVIQTMMLVAKSKGIGSCWIGLGKQYLATKEACQRYKIPEGYVGYYAITLGYPTEDQPKAPTRKTNVYEFWTKSN